MPKRGKRGSGFTRKQKPKEGTDRRYTGALPGRPRKAAPLPAEESGIAPSRRGRQQELAQLLWGGEDVYTSEIEAEVERYKKSGQFAAALAFIDSAGQSSYRARGLAGDKRRFQQALAHCAQAEHNANQYVIPFSMAARSVSFLSRRGASSRSWSENPTVLSKPAAYSLVENMMKIRPAHNFCGEKDLLNAVFVYDQVFRVDGCNTKSGGSMGLQRLNCNGAAINAGAVPIFLLTCSQSQLAHFNSDAHLTCFSRSGHAQLVHFTLP